MVGVWIYSKLLLRLADLQVTDLFLKINFKKYCLVMPLKPRGPR